MLQWWCQITKTLHELRSCGEAILLNHNIQNDDCLLIAQKVTTVSSRSWVKLVPLVPWSQITVHEYLTHVWSWGRTKMLGEKIVPVHLCAQQILYPIRTTRAEPNTAEGSYDLWQSHKSPQSHADVHHIHSPVSSSSASSLSDSKVLSGISYSRIIGLLGSFIIRYFPSFCFMQISTIQRRIPHALSIFSVICVANSFGLYCCVPKITCLDESRTWARETYLEFE